MFRKMRRFGQLLDDDEVKGVLTRARRGVLSVLGDGGYPYGIPLNYVYDPTRGEHGTIFFHCALEGHKLDAMRDHDKVCFTAYEECAPVEGQWWFHVRSVVCFCHARVIEDGQLRREAMVALAKKYFPPEIDIDADIAKSGHRIHMIELAIDHVTGKMVEEK